jgi:hypothetical protein
MKNTIVILVLTVSAAFGQAPATQTDNIQELIERISAVPRRGQFETTAEYQKRAGLAFDQKKVYHFQYKLNPGNLITEMSYDVDTQTATFGFKDYPPRFFRQPDVVWIGWAHSPKGIGYGLWLLNGQAFKAASVTLPAAEAKRIWNNLGISIEGTSTGQIENPNMGKTLVLDFKISELKIIVMDTSEVLWKRTL